MSSTISGSFSLDSNISATTPSILPKVYSTFLCVEKIDMEKLQTIHDHWVEFRDNVGNFYDPKTAYHAIVPEAAAKTKLKAYLKSRMSGDKILYKHTRNKLEGRMFSEGFSLQNLTRPLRHTIAREFYDDIDIKNCHPVLFEYLCSKNGFIHDRIKDYNQNRDERLLDLTSTFGVDKDDAKTWMLSMLNGGEPVAVNFVNEPGCENIKWLKPYLDEMTTLRNRILDLPEYKHYLTNAKKSKDKQYNFEGTAINNIFCKIENELLSVIINYCASKKYEIGALCFDGLMLLKDPNRDNKILCSDLMKEISNKTGITVEIVTKSMDEHFDLRGFKPLPSKDKLKDKESDILEQMGLDSDESAANSAFELLGDFLKITWSPRASGNEFGYMWNQTTLLWEKSSKEKICASIMFALRKYANSKLCSDEFVNSCIDKALKKLNSSGGQKSIFTVCIAKFQDTDFPTMVDLVNSDWLPLRGGIAYNMRTKEQRVRTPSDLYSKELSCTIVPDISRAVSYMEELFNGDYKRANKIVGYCWTPLNNLKKFILAIGENDTGKSTLWTMTTTNMGARHKTMDDKVIFEGKKAVHSDEMLFALNNTTLSTCNETSEKHTLNEAVLKQIVGNDSIAVRACGGVTQEIRCYTKVIVNTNNQPITSSDPTFLVKILYLRFPHKFVDNSENRNKVNALKQDKDFLDQLFSLQMEGAFEYYNDPSIDDDTFARDEYLGEDPISQWIDTMCEVGDHHIPVQHALASFKEWIKKNDSNIKVTDISFKKAMQARFKKKSHRICGTVTCCYFGLRLGCADLSESDISGSVSSGEYEVTMTRLLKKAKCLGNNGVSV